MPYVHVVPESEADGPLRRIYDAAIARSGGVASVLQVQSLDVRSLQASGQLYTNLMKSDNALSPARREMLATVVSNVNECFY